RLKKLPRRLVSRIVGGLVIALEPFSVPSRKAILLQHLETKHISLEVEALDWLAARPTGGGMRPLLGMLDALKATQRGRATPIALEQVRQLAMIEPVGVERIVKRVAETYGVKAKEMLGPSRLRT